MNKEREKIIGAIEVWQKNRLTSFTPRDILYDFGDQIIAALRTPSDGEAHAEIQRLRDAKRRALAIADERAKENVALREALEKIACERPMLLATQMRAVAVEALSNAPPASEGARESDEEHYLKCIKLRLETLYELTEAPNLREQISDEIDWVNEKLGDPVDPADTPDEGPDPLGYAKGES